MLPVFGRPLKAKSDTQSSEHGLVTTKMLTALLKLQQRRTERTVLR
jgi:hypothetical protein